MSLQTRLPGVRRSGTGQQRGGRALGQAGRPADSRTDGSVALSALARRLAGLRQQAGLAVPASPSKTLPPTASLAAEAPRANQAAQLRKLLGLRPRADAMVCSFDRALEGDEIAPGLRYIEKWVP